MPSRNGGYITCLMCGEIKYFSASIIRNGRKLCSQKCLGDYFRKYKPYSLFEKGKSGSPNTQFKKGVSSWNKDNHIWCLAEKNPDWKGDDVGYRALHLWISKHLGLPTKCEDCGTDKLYGRKIHWANRSRKYLRDLNDWIRLCAKCHKAFDRV